MFEHQLLLSMPGSTGWIYLILALAAVCFWIKTIVDVASSGFNNSTIKIGWLLLVIFLGIIGALIYVFAGREASSKTT